MSTYAWKTYTSADGLRRVWYDRRLRLWTMQPLGADGYQTEAACDYTPLRASAFLWLHPLCECGEAACPSLKPSACKLYAKV